MRPFNLAEERIAERNFCRQHVNRRLKIMAGLIVLAVTVGVGSFGCKMCIAGKSIALKTAVMGRNQPQEALRTAVADERLALVVITVLATVLLIALYVAHGRRKKLIDLMSASQDALAERAQLAAFGADIGVSLTQADDMQEMLRRCAQAMVCHLGVALARIWTLNERENVLELQASAGMYTHIDGPHGRVPVGQFKIGRIVQEREPYLTNAVVGDPNIADQEWAQREGIVAFAGYPLLLDDRVVGVMAVFARRELSETTTAATASAANGIVVGIQRKQAESRIRLHSAAINVADDLIAILAGDGRIVFANDAFQRQTGYSSEEIIGRDMSVLWPQRSEQDAWAAIASRLAWSGRMPCRAGDGSSYTADVTITSLADEDGRSEHLIVTARNIREREEYERLLEHQANHDALTGLPNRLLFEEELASVLSHHGRQHQQCAVLFIDLDRFNLVNDTAGHQAGDAALVETTSRLRSCLREGDVLGKMGGDEFVILVSNVQSAEDAATVADHVLEQVSIPFYIGGSRLVLGASIGVSIYPDNATDAEEMLRSAGAAMYRAKELGRNNCQFCSDELCRANLARADVERDLVLALERNEIEIYYQPIAEVRTMRIAGAEALLRWNHPEKGMISPSLFVPVAEETGMILQMGRIALETACKQCKSWQEIGYPDFEISVNVSPTQLSDVGFISEVDGAISQAGLAPHCLKLEVTETVLAEDDNAAADILRFLKSLGVRICIDDFGIGHSSLGRLRNLPIAHLKLDGAFIRNIDQNPKDRAVTESIVVMAHNLGMQVTAEWVEDEEQLAVIKSLDCDYAQGYLISPGLPAEAFGEFLQEWTFARRAADAA